MSLYRLSDVYRINLKDYKCIFFLNTFSIDDKLYDFITDNIKDDTTLVWNYAPGIIRNGVYDIENVHYISGMEIEEYTPTEILPLPGDGKHPDFPHLGIKSYDKDIKRTKEGNVIIASTHHKNFYSVLCSMPYTQLSDIFDIIKNSGVHIYSGADTTVYSDSRFFFMISAKDYDNTISFPKKITCRNIITGKVYRGEDVIPFKCAKGTGLFLEYLE